MKYLFIFVPLVLILSACAGASSPGGHNCDKGVCITVRAVEPILFDQPVIVAITVTSEKDIPALGISMFTFPIDAAVEGPWGWETNIKDGAVWKGGASWLVDIKANLPLIFTRTVRFPPREEIFSVIGHASTPSLRAVDEMRIQMTTAGGKVYLSGTPLPITPDVVNTPPPLLNPQGTPIPRPTEATFSSTPTRIPTPTRAPYP